MQDNSALRRSSPATHTIFGMPQTVNSAVYQTVDIIQQSLESGKKLIMQEVLGECPNYISFLALECIQLKVADTNPMISGNEDFASRPRSRYCVDS